MPRLIVELADRSYPIHADRGLLNDSDFLHQTLQQPRLLLVTDENVAPHWLAPLQRALGERLVHAVVLPAGEAQKNLVTLERLFDELARHRIGRDGALLALGGGVVGDLTGFAAACWQRGTAFHQIPTTLLAQVDASVGGKTAVNHPSGKNLIGAFHQPRSVIADTATLSTLPDREFRAGLAEVIKHALIADLELLVWLESRVRELNDRDPETVAECVIRCCRIKAAVVAEDETEQGRRAILNFGHTFAHVIEGACGYGEWLHGEAVAAGMALALELSRRLGNINEEGRDRGIALMRDLQLPVNAPALDHQTWLDWMARDKKATASGLRLIVLDRLGHASVRGDVSEADLLATIAWRPAAED
ncbi:3-dehydroquinate synthase [Natronospira bacteriovora]|uniref:3-dehydroquinate synthase n=1 Tax=Natronospira bacteriovora TaxID=3069753 RepID=A0ABU0W846_9GAMM|nr:3-dehydroquinate synthase [Natronospira sp. AB-CW4]MDQ2070203.1 3-dehydroquinate synthase [Natronospira sp. AB-CW4]